MQKAVPGATGAPQCGQYFASIFVVVCIVGCACIVGDGVEVYLFDGVFVDVLIRQKAIAAIINAMYIRIKPTKNSSVSIAPMIIIVPAALNKRSPERFDRSWNVFRKYIAISRLNMNTIARKGRKYILLNIMPCMSNMPKLWLNRIRFMRSVTYMPVML